MRVAAQLIVLIGDIAAVMAELTMPWRAEERFAITPPDEIQGLAGTHFR
jgi:hypothetical protein